MKSRTIKELIIFRYTPRFNPKEWEIKELKRVFSLDNNIVKEEKDKRPNKVRIDLIRDTKDLVNRSNNMIERDKIEIIVIVAIIIIVKLGLYYSRVAPSYGHSGESGEVGRTIYIRLINIILVYIIII
jgi:hypothetical protein